MVGEREPAGTVVIPHDVAAVDEYAGQAVTQYEPPQLTRRSIAIIKSNIELAQELVASVLEEGIDYGRLPGLPGQSLFDPGAAKIFAAFSVFPQHETLYHLDDGKVITWSIKAALRSHNTGRVVAEGVGSASTRETKYKYRWVPDPTEYGFNEEESATLKTKTDKRGDLLFRIPNPEHGELDNTLLQMAAKRAEVDAAKGMPGVGSALKKLFEGPSFGGREWNFFWGQVATMGLAQEEVHSLLGVTSVKEWLLKTGRDLPDCVAELQRKLADKFREGQAGAGAVPGAGARAAAKAPPSAARKGARVPQARQQALQEVAEKDLPDLTAVVKIAFQIWNIQPAEVWKQLGYTSAAAAVEAHVKPWDAYLQLRAINEVPPENAPAGDAPTS